MDWAGMAPLRNEVPKLGRAWRSYETKCRVLSRHGDVTKRSAEAWIGMPMLRNEVPKLGPAWPCYETNCAR
jgi:hypothetical protein